MSDVGFSSSHRALLVAFDSIIELCNRDHRTQGDTSQCADLGPERERYSGREEKSDM